MGTIWSSLSLCKTKLSRIPKLILLYLKRIVEHPKVNFFYHHFHHLSYSLSREMC